MPSALITIAKIFPIRALADGLQYAFDPRTTDAGFNGARHPDARDLDGCRGVADAPVPAPPAGRGRMSEASAPIGRRRASRDRYRGRTPIGRGCGCWSGWSSSRSRWSTRSAAYHRVGQGTDDRRRGGVRRRVHRGRRWSSASRFPIAWRSPLIAFLLGDRDGAHRAGSRELGDAVHLHASRSARSACASGWLSTRSLLCTGVCVGRLAARRLLRSGPRSATRSPPRGSGC